MGTSWVLYRLCYSSSLCINTNPLQNTIMKERNATNPRWDSPASLRILGIWPSMSRKGYFRWNRYGQWLRKVSQVNVSSTENVEWRISRKIQAKIRPTIKLVINQLMKRIGQNNCSNIGFEHWMLTGKSLNLISWAREKEVKEEKELTEVAK